MTGKLRFFRLWLGIGLFGCAVLLYAGLIPSPPQPVAWAYLDKVEHLLAFCVLGAWFGAIFPGRRVWLFIALVLFGGALELLQSLTGYRSAALPDMVADIVGTVMGLLLARAGLMRWLIHIDQHAFPERN